jgi:hypothetical protein
MALEGSPCRSSHLVGVKVHLGHSHGPPSRYMSIKRPLTAQRSTCRWRDQGPWLVSVTTRSPTHLWFPLGHRHVRETG